MARRTQAEAFNEWMKWFIEEPEHFKREWKSIVDFLGEEKSGVVPSYGERCVAFLAKLESGEIGAPPS